MPVVNKGDSTSKDILAVLDQMKGKFPNRKFDVGPLCAYEGNGTLVTLIELRFIKLRVKSSLSSI